jgi:hypothetical protein
MPATLSRSLPLFVAALAFAAAPVRADDSKPGVPPPMKKVANDTYTEWSRYKVGAFVEMTTESDSSGNKSTVKMTTKLLELTPEKLVLEMTMVSKMGAQEYPMPAQKQDVPKMVEVPDVKAPEVKPEEKPKEGSETIEVAGKKVACKTLESVTEVSGMKTTSKTWLTKEIPGGWAKQTSKTEGKSGDFVVNNVNTSTVTKFSLGG